MKIKLLVLSSLNVINSFDDLLFINGADYLSLLNQGLYKPLYGLKDKRLVVFILSLPVKSIVLLMQQKYRGPVQLQSELLPKTVFQISTNRSKISLSCGSTT